MSFGYAVGDVCAVLNLVERVAYEVRNYRNAPAHFQQLRLELDLMRSTLQQVISIEPADQVEHTNLQRIRAIAIHCLQPLQGFISKIQGKEASLGHFRTTRSLSSVGTRLHWSLISKADVEDLRKTILSEMVAINLLFSMQHLNYLKKTTMESEQQRRIQSAAAASQSTDVLKQTSTILQLVQHIPKVIIDMQTSADVHQMHQSTHLKQMEKNISHISDKMKRIHIDVNVATSLISRLGVRVSQAILRLFHLMTEIRKLIQLLLHCSNRLLHEVARNVQLLLSLQEKMQQVVRAIDAIPLHLTLEIIRLDDALGESWGLPFQACTQWHAFKNILSQVVYANGRAGAAHVSTDMFVIVAAKTGATINRYNWSRVAKAGMHVQQAMIINASSTQTQRNTCPYESCGGTLDPEPDVELSPATKGRTCLTCGRWSSIRRENQDALTFQPGAPTNRRNLLRPQLTSETILSSGNSRGLGSYGSTVSSVIPSMDSSQLEEDSTVFRRVQLHQVIKRVESAEEAERLLKQDEFHAPANLYMGLSCLMRADERAIGFLERAVTSDPWDSQIWYLLALAYQTLGAFQKAYEAYQQTIYREARIAEYWVSIGVMYHAVNQPHDAIDALIRATRVNSKNWTAWYNLGVAYDTTSQRTAAIDALERCLEIAPWVGVAREYLTQILKPSRMENRPIKRVMSHCPLCYASRPGQTTIYTSDPDNPRPERRSMAWFTPDSENPIHTSERWQNVPDFLTMSSDEESEEEDLEDGGSEDV